MRAWEARAQEAGQAAIAHASLGIVVGGSEDKKKKKRKHEGR